MDLLIHFKKLMKSREPGQIIEENIRLNLPEKLQFDDNIVMTLEIENGQHSEKKYPWDAKKVISDF